MAGQLSALLESFRTTTEPAREKMEEWQGRVQFVRSKAYRTVVQNRTCFTCNLCFAAHCDCSIPWPTWPRFPITD